MKASSIKIANETVDSKKSEGHFPHVTDLWGNPIHKTEAR